MNGQSLDRCTFELYPPDSVDARKNALSNISVPKAERIANTERETAVNRFETRVGHVSKRKWDKQSKDLPTLART